MTTRKRPTHGKSGRRAERLCRQISALLDAELGRETDGSDAQDVLAAVRAALVLRYPWGKIALTAE